MKLLFIKYLSNRLCFCARCALRRDIGYGVFLNERPAAATNSSGLWHNFVFSSIRRAKLWSQNLSHSCHPDYWWKFKNTEFWPSSSAICVGWSTQIRGILTQSLDHAASRRPKTSRGQKCFSTTERLQKSKHLIRHNSQLL
jgi:hypothetical protein